MAGMQDYFAARNAVMQAGERRREERRLEDQMGVRRQAGNALASGDLSGASNALFQGGDLEAGLAVDNAARTRQTADRDRQKSALAAAASGLLYVPEAQRAAMFQNTIRSRLVAEGVPEEVVNQITPDMLSDAQLRGFAAALGGDIQDAPTGYRWGSDGQSMQYIPGGPADPQNRPPTFIPGLGFVDPLVLRQYMGGQQPQPPAAPEYVDQLPPGVRPRPNQPSPASSAGGGNLIDALIQVESGGDPNAVSHKGARGRMQVMDYTNADPGFGVRPARDNSQAERERVGRDYLRAMQRRYGSDELALAAYNAGPGRVDRALEQSRRTGRSWIEFLPAETRNYVPAVMRRAGRG